jgi:hypothetical protein
MKITAAKTLNDRGQCCGRKPMNYKRDPAHLFCPRCDAAYSPETGKQIPNWAYYKLDDARFECRTSSCAPAHFEAPHDK